MRPQSKHESPVVTTEMHGLRGLQKKMPATLAQIDVVCDDMRAWLALRDLAHEQFSVTLLAREALVNAVVHGAALDLGQTIDVQLDLVGDHLVLSVEDPGRGFGWRDAVAREAAPFEDHGRGMMVFRSYASEIHYNDKGNRITLRKKLDPRRKQ